jgi:tetratricopeptide (TPR) repeat protein
MRSLASARLALILVAAVLTCACSGAQSRYESHMRHGQELFARGEFAKASVEFRNAMQIHPKDPAAMVMAGKTAEQLANYRQAVRFYRSALELAPDEVNARVQLGRLLILGGAADDAEEVIRPALERHPDNAPLLAVRAALRLARQDLAGAAADADRAIHLDPGNENAVALRAGLYRHNGESPKALSLVNEALRRAPQSLDLRQMLADLYAATGDRAHAEEQFRAVIALKPGEPAYRYQLAMYLSGENRPADAQRVLEEAVKELPDNTDVKLTLISFISTHTGRAAAEKQLRDLIAAAPRNNKLRLGLGDLLWRFNAIDAAIRVYGEIVQRDASGPDGVVARDHLASIALANGRWDEARRLLEQVLQANPRDNDALVLRADLELAETNAAAAIADLRAALRDQPQALGLRRVLARAYVASGNSALAEETLRAALADAPRDLGVRKELVQVLVRERQLPEQAVDLMEQAARTQPNDPAVHELLARTYLETGNYDAARATADELKIMRAGSAIGSYLAALAAAGQNQTDVAEREFDHALTLDPSNFEILSALATFERSRGRPDRAIAAVSLQSRRDPRNPLVLNLLGELHVAQGRSDLAREEFESSTKLAPQWWVPCHNLAQARATAGDPAGAVATYEAGLKLMPNEEQLAIGLGQLVEKQGQVDQAIARYDQFLAGHPSAQLVTNNLAMLLITYRTDRVSLERARAITAGFVNSSDATFLDTIGWVHFKLAEYPQAFALLKQAADRRPKSGEIRYHLGLAELQTGHPNEAREDLERAVTGSASFSDADHARALLAQLKSRPT